MSKGAQKHIQRCKAVKRKRTAEQEDARRQKELKLRAAAAGLHPREYERMQLMSQMLGCDFESVRRQQRGI